MAYIIQDRIQFLAEASRILSSSLDYKITLASIARLVVTNIADFCMIDLKEDNKLKLYRVASHVDDKRKEKVAQQMFNYPPDPKNKKAIYEAARTGKPILVRHITQIWLNKASQISEEHKVLKKLGVNSFIFVPLKSRKRIIGVVTLVLSGKKTYTKSDVVLAEELANRAGVAVDNARLFSESQEALKVRDLFLSMAAHEFRTPLTTISGYTQLLYTKLAGSNKPESRWVEELLAEGNRLTSLVNELLEVDRIKSGEFMYTWVTCSLRDIIKRAITDFSFTHPEYGVVLEDHIKNDQDKVIGDFNKLLQVIINLLDNAAKFSSSSSKITIFLEYKLPYVVLTVKDRGQGISKKDLPNIFDRFYKGIDHSQEGMGLGLFLAKSIIEAHQGKIKVSSKENKGTEVEIKLPKVRHN